MKFVKFSEFAEMLYLRVFCEFLVFLARADYRLLTEPEINRILTFTVLSVICH